MLYTIAMQTLLHVILLIMLNIHIVGYFNMFELKLVYPLGQIMNIFLPLLALTSLHDGGGW